MPRIGLLAGVAVIVVVGILAIGGPAPHVRAGGPIGVGWQNYDLIVSPGDWNRATNGAPDVIARKPSDGSLWLFAGDGMGGYTGPNQIGSGFNVYTHLVAAGNFTGGGGPDLLAVRNDGELILYPNAGHGVLGEPVSLGPGWGDFDSVLGAPNFNGDHLPAVIARSAIDGSLTLYKGDGHGGFSGHTLITSVSFTKYSLLAAP